MNEALPPAEFAKALKAKRSAARRRKLWLLGGGSAVLTLVLALGYLLFWSPVFAVREVKVHGITLVSHDEVAEAAQVPLGVPLLRQDAGAVSSAVEELPGVADAEVKLAWPDTVEIHVQERVAVYQVAKDGGYDWIDREAVVFRHTDEPADGVVVAEVRDDDERLREDLATVVSALPKDLAAQVEGVRAASIDRISLDLTEDRTVVWGSAESSSLKAEVLAVLLRVDAKVYDVSAPENPTTR